jgi:hypothetical protein
VHHAMWVKFTETRCRTGARPNFGLTAFCEVRPNGVLRSWLRASAGGIMLVVERDIPL